MDRQLNALTICEKDILLIHIDNDI